jgi:hypothetical protein
VPSSFEHVNEPSDFIKGNFLTGRATISSSRRTVFYEVRAKNAYKQWKGAGPAA